MLNIIKETTFKRDSKRQGKRNKDFSKFNKVIELLQNGQKLPEKYCDHKLVGQPKGHKTARDCHIDPDWVLIYDVVGNDLILIRTGTHEDLFDKKSKLQNSEQICSIHQCKGERVMNKENLKDKLKQELNRHLYVPNAETMQALEDSINGIGLTRIEGDNIDEVMNNLHDWLES